MEIIVPHLLTILLKGVSVRFMAILLYGTALAILLRGVSIRFMAILLCGIALAILL